MSGMERLKQYYITTWKNLAFLIEAYFDLIKKTKYENKPILYLHCYPPLNLNSWYREFQAEGRIMSLVIADNTANKDQPLTVTADKYDWVMMTLVTLQKKKTYFRMAFK